MNRINTQSAQTGYTEEERFTWEMTEVFKHVNIGFFSRDFQKNEYIRITENCAKIYGYRPADFFQNQHLWYERILPEDKFIAGNEFAVLERGENSEAEYRIFHKSGSIRWIEVKALPFFQDGTLVRVDGIVSDITDRKTAELQKIKAQELSEIILRTMPGIFYLFNKGGRYKYWNRQFLAATGYQDEEMDQVNPLIFFPEEHHEVLAGKIENVFTSGEDEIEGFLVTKDKRRIPYYFTGRRVVVDGEECVAGLGLDITERKKAEDLIMKNEEMLSHILNSLPQSIFWKDTNSRFLGCNTVFAKSTGLNSTADVVGKTDFDLSCAAEEASKYQKDDNQIIQSKEPRIHYLETMQNADGERVWIDTTKIPLKNKNDEVYGILGIFDDITQRKHEEERQKKIMKDLIEKNNGLREFSYVISHNLRAPVARIIGLASLIDSQREVDPLNRELVQYVAQEVLDIDAVIKDLNEILALQHTEIKSLSLTPFKDVFSRVSRCFEKEISETGASVTSDFTEVSEIKSVPAYVYNILYNLFSNSLKYRSPDRPLEIQVRTKVLSSFVCLMVKDNGRGLDVKKYGEKVFGLYNRFHTDEVTGKGIGLSLVKTQIEALGGKIEIESAPDEGCTLKVFFPHT